MFLVCFYFKFELFLQSFALFVIFCINLSLQEKLFGFYTCPENEKQMRNFFLLNSELPQWPVFTEDFI